MQIPKGKKKQLRSHRYPYSWSYPKSSITFDISVYHELLLVKVEGGSVYLLVKHFRLVISCKQSISSYQYISASKIVEKHFLNSR